MNLQLGNFWFYCNATQADSELTDNRPQKGARKNGEMKRAARVRKKKERGARAEMEEVSVPQEGGEVTGNL